MSGAVRVQVQALRASYRQLLGRRPVLNGLDFVAEPGQITAIVGRNGEGKTTLFRTLMGFQEPDSGTIEIGGVGAGEYRRSHGIGFVPDGQRFPPAWTAGDVLARGVDLAELPDPVAAFELAVTRADFGDDTLAREAGRCSKGNQQRLRLAYAMIGEPKVLLLDEPFAGLDPPSRIALRGHIADAAAGGAAVLLASHDLAEVARLAHSVFVLSDGVLTEAVSGSADDLEATLMEGDPS